MGYTTEVTESYWGVCYADVSVPCGVKMCKGWLGIKYPCGIKWCTVSLPYPCKKYRRVTKYCYQFGSVKDDCKVFLETHYGCENGREYKWTDGCFGWFSAYRSGVLVCFDEPLEELGPCRGGYSLPHGDVPHEPQWQDGVAIGGESYLVSEGNKAGQESSEQKSTDNIKFGPPMHVQRACKSCTLGKFLIIVAALYGLYCLIKYFI